MPKMKQISLRFLIIILFLGGLLLISKSGYYYGKGKVANILLENAWNKSRELNSKVVPWTWADIYPIAKLSIDSVKLSTVVLNNVSGEALAFGVGHLPSSAKPGTNGNIVISAHRDGVFRKLQNVHKNDIIILESTNGVDKYKVNEIIVTANDDVQWIDNTESNIITLITCYPFNYIGNSEQRFIIRANRIL